MECWGREPSWPVLGTYDPKPADPPLENELDGCEESYYRNMENGAPPWAAISSISSWSELGEERLLVELEDGADITATDGNGRTLLHWAAECNRRTGVIELLLEHGADVNARDGFWGYPTTPGGRR